MINTLPLLQLAEGRKVRPRRASILRPREIELHVAVARLLKDHCLPTWQWRHLSSKAKDAREGAILKVMGVKPGWPDFIFISPHGSIRCLELKRDGEEPSDSQDEFRMWCIAHGVPHVVAWTMDQVLAAMDDWGCLRIRINGAMKP